MPLYEHVFLARQDLAQAQVDALAENATKIITDNGGKVVKTETWGLRSIAYRIAKNRKAHYVALDLDAPANDQLTTVRLADDSVTVRDLLRRNGSTAPIEVDGGIDTSTAPRIVAAGADILVAGQAIFGSANAERATRELRAAAMAAVAS